MVALGRIFAEHLTALPVFFDDLHINAHMQQDLCQIKGRLAAADNHGIPHLICLNLDLLKKLAAAFGMATMEMISFSRSSKLPVGITT